MLEYIRCMYSNINKIINCPFCNAVDSEIRVIFKIVVYMEILKLNCFIQHLL